MLVVESTHGIFQMQYNNVKNLIRLNLGPQSLLDLGNGYKTRIYRIVVSIRFSAEWEALKDGLAHGKRFLSMH